jgi:hypothetical protein
MSLVFQHGNGKNRLWPIYGSFERKRVKAALSTILSVNIIKIICYNRLVFEDKTRQDSTLLSLKHLNVSMKYIHTTDERPPTLMARNYHSLFNFLFTYLFSIKFRYYFISFFLILTCTYPYSYHLVLTATYMCRPYITLIVNRVDEIVKKL